MGWRDKRGGRVDPSSASDLDHVAELAGILGRADLGEDMRGVCLAHRAVNDSALHGVVPTGACLIRHAHCEMGDSEAGGHGARVQCARGTRLALHCGRTGVLEVGEQLPVARGAVFVRRPFSSPRGIAAVVFTARWGKVRARRGELAHEGVEVQLLTLRGGCSLAVLVLDVELAQGHGGHDIRVERGQGGPNSSAASSSAPVCRISSGVGEAHRETRAP
mmetsp:Transcript_13534/g.40915  ORF Transcript_13534/g.40915 Transcript_13534/m.40915 type:complete len:219 (+) Transcript_13534:437-1093(+)